MTPTPQIELIGSELAISWGQETFFLPVAYLRANSPSAEVAGEVDIMGVKYGGENRKRDHSGVQIIGWQLMGNYAVRLQYSDGHQTGIYSYEYLKKLIERMPAS